MIAILAMTIAISGGHCQPDLITQLPIICNQTVSIPHRQTYPVTSDGQVSISAKFKQTTKLLKPSGSWGCEIWYSREGLIALISRCSTNIGVAVFRNKLNSPSKVTIVVAGQTLGLNKYQ